MFARCFLLLFHSCEYLREKYRDDSDTDEENYLTSS